MKRIISLLLIIIMAASFTALAEKVTYPYLNALGVNEYTIAKDGMEKTATRGQLAYIISKIYDGSDFETSDTVFEDVLKNNEYSGYINHLYNAGIMNGMNSTFFGVESPVKSPMVYKTMIRLFGGEYVALAEYLGGYEQGYIQICNDFQMKSYEKYDSEGNLTIESVLNMFERFLSNEFAGISIKLKGGEYSFEKTKDKYGFLGKNKQISVFEGVVTDINDNGYIAEVKIGEPVLESNYLNYSYGTTVNLKVNKNINLYEYQFVPCNIFVDKNGKIIYMAESDGVEVKYGIISAINGDEVSDSSYAKDYIEKVVLYDDDKNYSVTEDFTVSYNFEVTNAPVKLIDKYAKIVIKDRKISHIESWDVTEGGLVTEISSSSVTYTKGNVNGNKIDSLNKLARVNVIVDGENDMISRLRVGSYFDYYKADEKLVILASDRVVSDTFNSISNDSIKVGNVNYNRAPTLYVDSKYGYYIANGDVISLMGNIADVYFNIKGEACYIAHSSVNAKNQTQFIGMMMGSKSDIFDESSEIKVLSLESDLTEKIYKLKENAIFDCGYTKEQFLKFKSTINAEYVFLFTVDNDDCITKVSKAELYYGYETATQKFTSFPNGGESITVDGIGLYFQNAKAITVLVDEYGSIEAKTAKPGDFGGRPVQGGTSNPVYFKFFGNGEDSQIRLMLVYGGTHNITTYSPTKAVFVSKNKAYIDGEFYTKLTFLESSETSYLLPEEEYDLWPNEPTLCDFRKRIFSDNPLYIDNLITLGNAPISDTYSNVGLTEGIIKKVEGQRVYFEDGRVYFTKNIICVCYNTNTGEYTSSSLENLTPGTTVYYSLSYGLLNTIFYEK